MKISVIIPSYNVADYIEECVESVISQDYPDLEIICVDDGSGDETPQILTRLQSAHPDKMRVLLKENKGANSARNAGLGLATGMYLQFLDADDVLLPGKLNRQAELIAREQYPGFVAGSYIQRFPDGTELAHISSSVKLLEGLAARALGITSSNLWKREDVLQVGGWNEALRSSQEYDLLFRLIRNKSRSAFDSVPLTILRTRTAGSITYTNREDNGVRRLDLLNDVKKYALEQNESSQAATIEQVMFGVLREVSNYNQTRAIELFSKYFEPNFQPLPGGANTRSYVMSYKLLGFSGAEKFVRLYRKMIDRKAGI